MDDSQEIPLIEHQRRRLEHLRASEASGKDIAAYASGYGSHVRGQEGAGHEGCTAMNPPESLPARTGKGGR